MSAQKSAMKFLKSQDITKDGWTDDFLDSIPDLFARGFLSAHIGTLNECFSYEDEEFREELLKVCNWTIWNVS